MLIFIRKCNRYQANDTGILITMKKTGLILWQHTLKTHYSMLLLLPKNSTLFNLTKNRDDLT